MAQISLRVDDDVKRNAERTLTDIVFLLSCLLILFTVRRIWMNLKDV